MPSVGLVGGLGPESTIDYYRRILKSWADLRPGTAPPVVIDSVDNRYFLRLVEHDTPAVLPYLLESLHRLAGAGVTFAAITANTPHLVFDELARRSPVPLVSIVETCAQEAARRGLRCVGLLGTRFTMSGTFYTATFARLGIRVVPPADRELSWVHDRYIGELVNGQFLDDTRHGFVSIIDRMRLRDGIDGVILGGTELPLLLSRADIAHVPALDTTALHVAAIVDRLAAGDVSPSRAADPATL
jgi:aspartate racemase